MKRSHYEEISHLFTSPYHNCWWEKIEWEGSSLVEAWMAAIKAANSLYKGMLFLVYENSQREPSLPQPLQAAIQRVERGTVSLEWDRRSRPEKRPGGIYVVRVVGARRRTHRWLYLYLRPIRHLFDADLEDTDLLGINMVEWMDELKLTHPKNILQQSRR